MSDIELVILGTASQTPTRTRNHNGYLLRWGSESLLFDPGEGTQRQITLAEASARSIRRICLTHFHGDHTFGLPGVLSRLALERPGHEVDLHYPAGGESTLAHLLGVAPGGWGLDLRKNPASGSGVAVDTGQYRLLHEPLHHRVDTVGWRVEEPDSRRMVPERLAQLGIAGPDIGRLQTEGSIVVEGRRVELAEMSEPRPGRSVAVVMDTAWCDGALRLAENADLLLCEATFLSTEEDLARQAQHLTADQAGRLAAESGAKRLVLTHFSQRYRDIEPFLTEAGKWHTDVSLAREFDRISVTRH